MCSCTKGGPLSAVSRGNTSSDRVLVSSIATGRIVIHGREAYRCFGHWGHFSRRLERPTSAGLFTEGFRGLSVSPPCVRLPDRCDVPNQVLLLQAKSDPELLQVEENADQRCRGSLAR